jgi:ABC transporter substrate binding protein
MSSIIAKPLRRQSHRWHSSFTFARWRSEPSLEPFRLSPVLRAGTEAVSRSGINALHWELRGQAALIATGNQTRKQQTIASRTAWAAQRRFLSTDPLLIANLARINTLAPSAQVPTIGSWREFVEAGSLMSYGSNIPDQFRRAADLVNRILREAKPSDIPVEQATKFELVITSRPRRHSVLKFHPRCSLVPIR